MIVTLKGQLQSLNAVKTLEELNCWKEKTAIFVSRIYKETSTQYRQFTRISAYPGIITAHTQPDVPKAVNQAKNLLQGFVEDIETFGLPTNSSIKPAKFHSNMPNINIENNLTQSQVQKQDVHFNIEDIIKDEIPPNKMREIQEVIKTDEPKETKLQKIGEILHKTGVEVVSSTLAKIITSCMGLP